MKHTVEKITPSEVKATVEVDAALWKDAQEKAFKKLAKNVKVDGFRPGKAPEAMLRARMKQEDVWNEALDTVLTPAFADVLTAEKLNPFSRPNVDIVSITPAALTVAFHFVLVPEVEIGEYKGVKATKEAPGVTDEEVEASITKLLENNASLVLVERPAKLGDTVTLDFKGFLTDENGKLVAFDGGEANNYELVLGSNSFVPGFEDALVGALTDEKRDIKVTFPEAYVKELAGKEATFKCVIHEIKEKQIPELNEESIAELAIAGVTTIDELKEHQKTTLLANKVAQSEAKYYDAIIGKIVEASKFTIDPKVIESEIARKMDEFHHQLEHQGLSEEQYFEITNTTKEVLEGNYRAQAETEIEGYLVLNKIAELEKIEATDADLDEEIKKLAAQYKMEEAKVSEIVKGQPDQWLANIKDRKIREFILSVSK